MCTYAYPSQLEVMQHQFGANFSQIFMHKSAMQLHAREVHRSEVKPHQCQQCLKSFSSNHQLVQHIRVHTGEKPYKCSYCDRRFKQLSHVQQHTRLHTGERPYKCHYPECGRAFIQLSNLQQHLRNHDSQIERMKNRPFHCQICGKGFATESSLRTHTTKHAALIGGPNAVNCPLCHKMYLGGAALMEHMKHVHKDPNASGVAAKRRTPNHPCPVCGKQYVNEGSLRKHMATHPEAAGLASPLRMWPCSVCQAVFTHESAFLTHMDHMRMDPKHQFAAQYVLSRAAAERRERETLFAAAAAAAASSSMGMNGHMFPGMSMAGMNHMSSPLVTAASAASPSAHSDSSRISTPAEPKLEPRSAGVAGLLQHAPPPGLPTGADGSSELERADLMAGHAAQQRMEAVAGSRLTMLNRLGVQHAAAMAGPLALPPPPAPQQQQQQQQHQQHQQQQQQQQQQETQHQQHQHQHQQHQQQHLQQHHQQHSQPEQQQQQQPRPGDSMRAIIQQTQAELVKSTLSSQAESTRSLDVLRSLNTQAAESMVGQADLRMFQADLAIRSSHELYGQQVAPQPGEPLSAAGGDPFRLSDSLRGHHDPRAGLGGYLASSQQN